MENAAVDSGNIKVTHSGYSDPTQTGRGGSVSRRQISQREMKQREQKDLQLGARIYQLDERYAILRVKKSMDKDELPSRTTRKATDSRYPSQSFQVCFSSPKHVCHTVPTTSTKRGWPMQAVYDLALMTFLLVVVKYLSENSLHYDWKSSIEDLKNHHLNALSLIFQCQGIR